MCINTSGNPRAFAHNPLESHSFPACALRFSHTNAQVLIPCHHFSVAALGLNPHAHYLSPVTITRHHHPSLNSLSPVSNPLLLATKPSLPVKGGQNPAFVTVAIATQICCCHHVGQVHDEVE